MQHRTNASALTVGMVLAIAGLVLPVAGAQPQEQRLAPGFPGAPPGPPAQGDAAAPDKPEFPDFKEVTKDFVKVVSTADGSQSMWTVYRREKDNQLLAELPREFESQRYFFAMTLARGSMWAGLQGSDMYVYWKRYDKTLALIAPELENRSTGDAESKSSVNQLFTDRVILELPIATMGPGGGPVIDLDALLVGQASKFFGPGAAGLSPTLSAVKEAKAFPDNVEISIEAPLPAAPRSAFSFTMPDTGRLQTFHYSISLIRENPAYKPREADERVGYFTTVYRDLGELGKINKWKRYVNRWHLEKADPKLNVSPAKEPIVFYVEHTVPIRYRRWVREGVLYWNKAFEKVGISNAMEVYYQDKTTGAHMDKDPEDVRFNFIRWLSNDISTAIGPSRANPLTGEILDADIILTDGWIRAFWSMSNEILPDIAMDNFGPDSMAWLAKNPNWDPRIRLAPPGQRDFLLAQQAARGVQRFGGHPAATVDPTLMGDDLFDGLAGRTSQTNGMCMAAQGRAADIAFAGMAMDMLDMIIDADQPAADGPKPDADKKDEPKEEKLDGIPEWFIGPLLADLVAHEVGHTLGLRHNFKASAIYSMSQINSEEWKGKKPIGGSVMDYNALPQINVGTGAVQGDYGMIAVGPYDMWAIEYGYTLGDPKKVLERVAEPELVYATDEDTWGPDPLARRRDMGSDPLTFAKSRVKLAQDLRARIIDRFVKDGDSWSKARRGYMITLSQHLNSLGVMANWIGGAHITRDKKGDPNARAPITPVPAQTQRDALQFVLENAFRDEAFGLTPELVNKMTVDKWWDQGGMNDIFEDETWPIHERILGLQATVLSMLMNPTSLGRVYDNEFRVSPDQDMISLPEVVNAVSDEIWSELKPLTGRYTDRKPMVTSLRRNLQREHLERLIDLSSPGMFFGSAEKSVATVATGKLRELQSRIETILPPDNARDLPRKPDALDNYTYSHLVESRAKIVRALDSIQIYNANQIGGGGMIILMGNETQPASR
ncbi:MAG: zinc-dependent metalloprotease [Planctomycetota bacterium]|nr:zinc-dependent metalloprotease [Planctomycetota bacterium]